MTAASRSLATALWRARFTSGLLQLSYTTRRDTTIRALFAVCCCFLGRDLSSKKIRSIMAMNGSSFGLAGGFVRR